MAFDQLQKFTQFSRTAMYQHNGILFTTFDAPAQDTPHSVRGPAVVLHMCCHMGQLELAGKAPGIPAARKEGGSPEGGDYFTVRVN